MHRGEIDTTTDEDTVIGRRISPSRQLAIERNDSDPIDEMDEIEADVTERVSYSKFAMLG